jgi:hypothetical protein
MIKTDAEGVEAFLIRTFQGRVVLRVYDNRHEFIDYDIKHHDLQIKITDTDAAFYNDGRHPSIDYKDV